METQNTDTNELIKRRFEELDELYEKGFEPFAYSYDVDNYSETIKNNFEELEQKDVKIAGRIMAIRRMGKASFTHIQDKEGRIQIYLRKDEIGEEYDAFKLMDIGDIVGVEGYVFKTRTGETSVHVRSMTILSKSMRPIPIAKETVDEDGNKVIHDQFADKELRYRQRYVDLIVNPDVKEVFKKRSSIVTTIRSFLDANEFVEVETPVLQPVYGGAAARPFVTHHNTLDMDLYLRIADELYLKRLIVGGFDRVYEIAKDFRNEGIDKTHNPEFTMLELYVAFKDYNWMMKFTEQMIEDVATKVFGTTKFEIDGTMIDFKGPWIRLSMVDSIKESTGVDITNTTLDELKAALKKYNIELEDSANNGKMIDELFGAAVEPSIVQPTFVIDYPIEISPLAKKHRTKEGLVERFEGYVLGREICNAFSELNDPIDQKERFLSQVAMKEAGDDEATPIDDDYIRAMEFGMPPTAGLGIGIDRLVMLLTNQPTIRDVILFPQMRKEK
ncbi:MAG: lysine--tRNA ligase [Melioribacteraceae bacterium]|nr:lysine--tRNA ligase [Melioribacteraceae bacterium]